jgi:glycosyltransferase involved in cell wall biosynthesis
MSKIIYFPFRGNQAGGGPHIFVYKMTQALVKRGYKINYDKPNRADVALGIIESGKLLKKVNRAKTRVVTRVNGIYNDLYNKKFNRAVRPDMIALHNKLRSDLGSNGVDHVVYQSQWSYDRISDEICERKNNYSIIHNGVDVSLFKPSKASRNDGFINLGHIAKMRDQYLMETLIGVYLELKKNHKVRLILVGSMDAACSSVYNKHASDKNIIKYGSVNNSSLPKVYSMLDVFLAVRQGASCSNIIAEAQACSIPLVCPAWGGDQEMVEDGKTGVIVDGGMWDYNNSYIKNLANGVEQVIPDLDGFRKRARQHAVKNLTIDIMVDKYLKAMGI